MGYFVVQLRKKKLDLTSEKGNAYAETYSILSLRILDILMLLIAITMIKSVINLFLFGLGDSTSDDGKSIYL